MIRVAKPRNSRSKRALEKRESKEHESAKTALFVRGPHSSDKVALALREFSLLKKPHAIPFSKQNDIVPFEDASSIEFWGKKNDASLFLLANHQKKRTHNLTWVRLFDGAVLDMYEMGIVNIKGHEHFKVRREEKILVLLTTSQSKHSPSIGARPLFHFSGPSFSTDLDNYNSSSLCTSGMTQSFQHIKSLFLDFYRGEEMQPGSGPGSNPASQGDRVALKGGLQHLITIVEGPGDDEANHTASNGTAQGLEALYKAGAAKIDANSSTMIDTSAQGRIIHLRVYAIVGGNGENKGVDLEEIGPSIDFVLRRRQMPSMDRLAASLKRPKTQADKSRQGKAGAKKNIETDDMGDMVGRVHVGKQDLNKLQTRKMKALKRSRQEESSDEEEGEEDRSTGSSEEEDDLAMEEELSESASLDDE